MPVQAFIIMDSSEKDAAIAITPPSVRVIPRLIDNPLSNNLGHGNLLGMYVAPARLLNFTDYEPWYEMFEDNTILVLDSEIIFLPDEEI